MLFIISIIPTAMGGALHKYDLKKRNDQEITDLTWYLLSADKKKMLYLKGGSLVGG